MCERERERASESEKFLEAKKVKETETFEGFFFNVFFLSFFFFF